MAHRRPYEKLEKSMMRSASKHAKGVHRGIGRFFTAFFKACDRKLTIMIVPHSQNNVINFRTNVFSLVLGTVIVIGMVLSFFYFNKRNVDVTTEIVRLEEENRETLASFDVLRDENNNLLQAAEKFKKSLNESLALVGINLTSSERSSTGDSDLASLTDLQTSAMGSVREISDVQQLTSYIEGVVEPIEQIGEIVSSQQVMFSNTPNIWPLKGGIGRITHEFGHAIHPINGQWYIHIGLDFATGRIGDPIIATANGKIVSNSYSDSHGISVIIEHKYGYRTRYSHMSTTYVTLGQEVSQGEVIGTIGNTGMSTGPHLHYEVHIGSSVVDPAQYINVKLSN
ncbi:MAG: M23 family metallopeptidase [Spirochaetales bacterium]